MDRRTHLAILKYGKLYCQSLFQYESAFVTSQRSVRCRLNGPYLLPENSFKLLCDMKRKPIQIDKPISLAPLTTAQALGAALRIKPADLKAVEKAERAKKTGKGANG